MKTLMPRKFGPALALLLVTLILGGCATNKVDWNARIGNLTFDQAVLEFGPPLKQARLTDGTIVAEWQTQQGRTHTYYEPAYGVGYRHRYYGHSYPIPVTTSTPDCFLRLTFDPAGQLAAWKKIML
jgi:hypothetical protein